MDFPIVSGDLVELDPHLGRPGAVRSAGGGAEGGGEEDRGDGETMDVARQPRLAMIR